MPKQFYVKGEKTERNIYISLVAFTVIVLMIVAWKYWLSIN